MVARLQSMEPFVTAAVATPSPDVLAALTGSLRGVEEWIEGIEAPADSTAAHAALRARVHHLLGTVSAATPRPLQ